jgi:hypothetical protein
LRANHLNVLLRIRRYVCRIFFHKFDGLRRQHPGAEVPVHLARGIFLHQTKQPL